jgi:hypothetical protein
MTDAPFVPNDFEVPTELDGDGFRLEPLGPEHNSSDHLAWSSSIEHIRATPGFADSTWPTPMSSDDNRRDLERHRRDFDERTGFTYTVLDADDVVIGCLYIYPARPPATGADVRSWVSAERAELDVPLWQSVSAWLATTWPFDAVIYAARDDGADQTTP